MQGFPKSATVPPVRASFDEFLVDAGTRQLLKQGAEVRLSPKAFDLLLILLAQRPNVVTKAELHARLWPDVYVSDASLAMAVADLRSALGDDAQQPKYIRTVHRRGYAFQAQAADGVTGAVDALRCWLEGGGRQFPLRVGEHTIGRDPSASVFLDDASVSRRHARLRIAEGLAMIEDLGSKNGTRLRGARLDAPAQLIDGDEIHAGGVRLVFRVWSHDPTETVTGIR